MADHEHGLPRSIVPEAGGDPPSILLDEGRIGRSVAQFVAERDLNDSQ